jgi:dynein assembly factor 1
MRKRNITRDENGYIVMTKRYVQDLCEEEDQYITPKFNTKLYLNAKGFSNVAQLEEYVNVEVVWLQSNWIEKIEGLGHLTKLKYLYLQDNMITKIENLESLHGLERLDLSKNRITKIEGLAQLGNLKDLMIASNRLASSDSIAELVTVAESLAFLNLSENRIEQDEGLLPLLRTLVHLRSLDFFGNPASIQLSQYRKTFITSLPQVAYLDNRQISEAERRMAEAYCTQGPEAEQLIKHTILQEQAAKREQEKVLNKDYFKKIDERVKRSLASMQAERKLECIKLLQIREMLTKRKNLC